MAGINFDITGNNSHFLDAMNGVRQSVRQTVRLVEQAGGEIGSVFEKMSKKGLSLDTSGLDTQANSAIRSFERVAQSLGASADVAEAAKKKFAEALLTITNSGEDVATKQQNLTNAIRGIFTEMAEGAGQVSKVGDAMKTFSDEALKGMDEELKKLCGNLNGYFGNLRDQLYEMLAVVSDAQDALNNVNVTDSNSDAIEQARNQAEEIGRAIEKQIALVESEQAAYQTLATSIGVSTNVRNTANNVTNAEIAATGMAITSTQQRIQAQDELTEATKRTTQAQEEQNEAIQESPAKEVAEVTTSAGGNFGVDTLEVEIESAEKELALLQDKLTHVATGSLEYQGILEQIQAKQAEIDQKRAEIEKAATAAPPTPRGGLYEFVDEVGKKFLVAGENIDDAKSRAEVFFRTMEQLHGIRETIGDAVDRLPAGGEKDKLTFQLDNYLGKLKEIQSTADLAYQGMINPSTKSNIEGLARVEESMQNIAAAREKAIEEEKRIAAEQERQKKLREEQAASMESLRTKIQKAREEIYALREAGKENTEEFDRAVRKAADLEDAMRKVNWAMEYNRQGGTITAFKDALQGVAGAASLATGVIGLFNKNSQEMIAIQTRIQSLLGIIVGLQQSYNFAMKAGIILQKLFMKSGPWGWILTGITAATAALAYFFNKSKKLTEAQKEQKKRAEDLKKTYETFGNSVASAASSQLTAYRKLQRAWAEANGDLKKQKKIIENNKTVFNQLGFSVNTVSDAERILVSNTDAVVNAIMARARAAAYEKVMTDTLEKQIREQIKADKENNSVKGGAFQHYVRAGASANHKSAAYEEAKKAGYKPRKGDVDENGNWTAQGAANVNYYAGLDKERRKAEAQQKDKKRNDQYNKDVKNLEGKIRQEEEANKNALKGVGAPLYEGKEKPTKTNHRAEDIRAQELQDQWKHEEEMKKLQLEEQRAREDALIAQIEDDAERERRVRDTNYRREKEDLELKENEILKTIYNQRKRAYETEHKNDKDGGHYELTSTGGGGWMALKGGKGLNDSESAQYNAFMATLYSKGIIKEAEYTRTLKNENQKRLQSVRDFLKMYGDEIQKQDAIKEDYAEKISKAESEKDYAKVATLLIEQEKALKESQAQIIKDSINWEAIFQDVADYDVKFLDQIEGDLQEAIKQGIEQGIDAADLKALSDKLIEVRRTLVEKKGGLFSSEGLLGGSWAGSITAQRNRQNLLERDAVEARERADKLNAKSAEAQKGVLAAKGNLEYAMAFFGGDSDEVKKAKAEKEAADKKAADAEKAAQQGKANAEKAQGAALSNAKTMAIGITDTIIHGVNDNIQSASKMITEWGIGGEDFQEKFAKFAESSQYATAAFDSLKNGDIAGVIYNAGEAFNSLGESFGIWSNSNREEVERENERLAMATEINTRAIEKLTKVMEEGSIADAVKAAEKMRAEYNQNQQIALQTMLNNTGMYDGGHSLREDWNDNNVSVDLRTGRRTSKIVEDIKRVLGPFLTTEELEGLNKWAGLDEILRINPQTLAKLYELEGGTDILNELTDSITEAQDKGNYNGLSNDLINYIAEFGEDIEKKIKDQLKEKITGTTFEGFRDGYKSMLMDMEKDTDDFVDDITKKMQESFISDMVDSKFKDDLEKIYVAWSELAENREKMEKEGTFEDRLKDIKENEEKLAQSMIAERDRLAALTGYDDVSSSEASGSINAAKSLSEDTANELVGRITATQIAVETFRVQQGAAMTTTNAYLATITAAMAETKNATAVSTAQSQVLNDMLFQQVKSNEYLMDIMNYNKAMYEEWGSDIQAMRRKIDTL